jgi:hypothetical protein
MVVAAVVAAMAVGPVVAVVAAGVPRSAAAGAGVAVADASVAP